jgi:uncharacterized FAD-dependent dehydrogenase
MPFIYRNLAISPHDGEENLPLLLAPLLGLAPADISDFHIVRKGVDARHKQRIKLIYTLSFMVKDSAALLARLATITNLEWQAEPERTRFTPLTSQQQIIIVGSGPAGLFTALRLSCHGLTATIIERGQPVEQRALDVQQFWRNGLLDPESNVQFGEGGAGTFSDGKLTCRSKDPLVPWILEQLAAFGAPPEVRYLAKPHIGTDRLRLVVSAIRKHLLDCGFTIRFGCRLSNIAVHNGTVSAITVNDREDLPCDRLILATGHSARDTYEMLNRCGVPLERKPFAMGLRVEHPQELIDRIQYGSARHPNLPVADYAVTYNNATTGRSAYSFCMCPGGVVIGGSSEAGGVITNGMSGQKRNSAFANSALVVNVTPDDFGGTDPLAGVRFQRHWEQQAFLAGGSGYHAPAQNLLGFLRLPGKGVTSSTYRPGIIETELDPVLPPFIISTLREGIIDFNRRLRGFVTAEATLIGIESRTSAPVRVLRDGQYESIGMRGLYPTGEGAGYAGGIMSSAVDGVKVADTIAAQLRMEPSNP